MIEARTVAFILIILLIAFIVYRLCLSNERKTKGGFDNLNDVVLAVYDSIEKDTKLEDIDIDAAKSEVLETLNLVLKDAKETLKETLKSAFYDTLNDDEKLAFIEALIHSFYVEGYVPTEFIGVVQGKEQVILKARHNYKYNDIIIYLNDLPNEINDMSNYLNAIKDETKYKISICNSIKAHSVSESCRWGVYEYVDDNRTMDIDYDEFSVLSETENIRTSDITKTIYIPDSKIYGLLNDSKDLNNISNNPGLLSISQPRTPDVSDTQANPISIINPSNESVRVDENIDNNIDNNSKTSAPDQLGVYDADAMQNDSYNKTNSESDNEPDNGLKFVELNDLN